ncbi:MAG: hypothetical protein AAFV59_05125 [Pseudomonadota bacterium]
MQTEETYDDLTALFAEQDEALQNEAFVEQVMQPIRRRTRWRAPLLFGAGGLGVGAALSQIGGLLDAVQVRVAGVKQTVTQASTTSWDVMAVDPLWIGALALMLVSCVAIVATERG